MTDAEVTRSIAKQLRAAKRLKGITLDAIGDDLVEFKGCTRNNVLRIMRGRTPSIPLNPLRHICEAVGLDILTVLHKAGV